MRRLAVLVCAPALMIALAATAGALADETPSIQEVMRKLHKGANSPLARLKKELNSDAPAWSDVKTTTKDFVILGATLAKNEPPKGESASWEKLAKAYFDDSKAMDEAAEKEDQEAAKSAFGKVAGSCAACHKAHRP